MKYLEDLFPKNEPLTPGMYSEFVNCNSQYPLSEKELSEEISSDGEFNDAA